MKIGEFVEIVVIVSIVGVFGAVVYSICKSVENGNYRAIMYQCLLKDTAVNCAAALKEIQK